MAGGLREGGIEGLMQRVEEGGEDEYLVVDAFEWREGGGKMCVM